MRTLVVTGAAGDLAGRLRRLFKGVYPDIRWSDLKRPDNRGPDDEFIAADLADLDAMERVLDGAEAVVHLGGEAWEAPWEHIRRVNIDGCYNVFEAARRRKVERVVYASSNHTVGFYPRRRRIGTNAPVRPDSRYGVSKAVGEALAALYAFKYGIRVTCLRIGRVDDVPADRRRLSAWLHEEDFAQLVRIGLEHPDIRHEIFFGFSDNDRTWWDNEAAFRFGYRPRHKAEDHAAAVLDQPEPPAANPVADWYQGGGFCSDEFDGGIEQSPV
jgi:uronate dehydrogenase